MRIMLLIVVIIACVLGYGYWHSLTHASFHIQLDFRDDNNGTQEVLPKVEIDFMDAEGRVLAQGIGDEHYNTVHLIHPEVGDCQQAEKSAPFSGKGRSTWQECFEHMSTWTATWASKVRQVGIQTQQCSWSNIPVTVSKSHSDWFLWWVPHPHLGGKPYAYYSLYITVGDEQCDNPT